MTIGIIGGGNLGQAIARGLVQARYVPAEKITVSRRKIDLLKPLQAEGIKITDNNLELVAQSEVVILAVKPAHIEKVLTQIKPQLESEKHLLISVITGISLDQLKQYSAHKVPIFRAMPNTAIAIRESMTCICSRGEPIALEAKVKDIFDQLGESLSIEEELMDAATVLGACGIAYALRFIRAASQGGIEIGFSSKTAQKIATQTVKGAASLLLANETHPEEEIDKVTTPQGCTIAGLNEMEHRGFSSALIKGIITSKAKIKP